MGNQQSRENLKRSMTMRRGGNRSEVADEYSAIDIRVKYERMPTVSSQERMIIKSSWRTIKNKVIQQRGQEFFIHTFDVQFKPPIGVTPVFRGHGDKMIQVVGQAIDKLVDGMEPSEDESQILWDMLIEHGRLYLGYGALPMYFDVMGTNFVIAVRQAMENEWYEALEFNWLQLFEMLSFTMKFGWNLQRAEEQKQASQMSKKRTLGFTME